MARTTDDPGTLGSVAKRIIVRTLAQARVAGPARVESYQDGARTVRVKPLIRPPGAVGGTVEQPALLDVPVLWPGSGRVRLRFPLRRGDQVMLLHLDHASDAWALGLQQPTALDPPLVDPAEVRSHDYTDCVAFPIATLDPTSSLSPDRVVLENGSAQLALIDGGKLALGTAGGIEVLLVLETLFNVLKGDPGISGAGQAALLAAEQAIASIRGTL